jgi:Universal stress protein family
VLGDPATALIEAARDADLLVVGNHRRGALASAFVGGVTVLADTGIALTITLSTWALVRSQYRSSTRNRLVRALR